MSLIITFWRCLSSSQKGRFGNSNPDLHCNANAVFYQLSYQANWEQVVAFLTAARAVLECDDQGHSFQSLFQIHGRCLYYHHSSRVEWPSCCLLFRWWYIYGTCTADHDSDLEGLNVAKCNLGKVNLKSMHSAVFPRNMHAGWLKGFVLPCADKSALFAICSCFAIIAVFSTLFW